MKKAVVLYLCIMVFPAISFAVKSTLDKKIVKSKVFDDLVLCMTRELERLPDGTISNSVTDTIVNVICKKQLSKLAEATYQALTHQFGIELTQEEKQSMLQEIAGELKQSLLKEMREQPRQSLN